MKNSEKKCVNKQVSERVKKLLVNLKSQRSVYKLVEEFNAPQVTVCADCYKPTLFCNCYDLTYIAYVLFDTVYYIPMGESYIDVYTLECTNLVYQRRILK